MDVDCYPITSMAGVTALYRDYCDAAGSKHADALRRWYPAEPFSMAWSSQSPELSAGHRETLADALLEQARGFGSSEAAVANIEKLRGGAAAVVTGQQVGLFGGPLLTLLKAATVVRKAADATAASGRQHVPVFWLASEDHDLAEVDQVALLGKHAVEKLSLGLKEKWPVPVGAMVVDGGSDEGCVRLEQMLEQASELLGWAPVCEWMSECYAPGATLAGAFGKLLSRIFAAQGLIVMDAASCAFHVLGEPVLQAAITQAAELEAALLDRSRELENAGYHAQVLVSAGHSLLFLVEEETGARVALRRGADGVWKAGSRAFTQEELLAVLRDAPERLSPNALLRPVFQDCILPTAAYVGGPAEIAYFAQSAVVYEKILGRVTPVLPRLSATLIEPAIAQTMAAHEVDFQQVIAAKTTDALEMRLAARAMPIEGKRKIAAVGNAMDAELTALTEYMSAMSDELGRAAGVSASKMRYQMNRLRQMAARFELQKEVSLKKHADAIMLHVLPEGHLQERMVAGVWFVARYGEGLASLLVEYAGQECAGHRVIRL